MKKQSRLLVVLAALTLALLSPSIGWGQVGSDIAIQMQSGNWLQAIPGAQITVCSSAGVPSGNTCTPQADIFADQTLSGPPLTQPITADANGNYTIFAPGTLYFVCVVNPNVTPNTHFCKLIQIGLSGSFAPINSPNFTGVPTAPTPANGDNSTKIATTAFVLANVGGTGSLSGSATLFSGQNGIIGNKTVDISPIGTLDWFIPSPSFSGTNGIKGTIKRGTNLSGWLQKVYNDQAGSLGVAGTSSTTISSDAADSANGAYAANTTFHGITPASGVAANLGIGFRISAPADSQSTRNLNLYLCAWPGAVAGSPTSTVVVTAFLVDGSAAPVTVSFNPTPSNGNLDVWIVNLQFKGATSTILEVKVEVTQQSSGSSEIGLLAAAIF